MYVSSTLDDLQQVFFRFSFWSGENYEQCLVSDTVGDPKVTSPLHLVALVPVSLIKEGTFS